MNGSVIGSVIWEEMPAKGVEFAWSETVVSLAVHLPEGKT